MYRPPPSPACPNSCSPAADFSAGSWARSPAAAPRCSSTATPAGGSSSRGRTRAAWAVACRPRAWSTWPCSTRGGLVSRPRWPFHRACAWAKPCRWCRPTRVSAKPVRPRSASHPRSRAGSWSTGAAAPPCAPASRASPTSVATRPNGARCWPGATRRSVRPAWGRSTRCTRMKKTRSTPAPTARCRANTVCKARACPSPWASRSVPTRT
ncbi:hypothetical protein FQZ97_932260 [compost metagenome]